MNILVFKFQYLCSVPTAEVPGDAMSECSGGIQGEGPTLHHMTTGETNIQNKIKMIDVKSPQQGFAFKYVINNKDDFTFARQLGCD